MNKRERDIRPWIIAGITTTLVGITLAIAIVQRMSNEAIAVLAGAVCGVGASIPTSLLVIAVATRRERHAPNPYPAQGVQIPPIILQQPTLPQPGVGVEPPPWGATITRQPTREFQVVGDDD